MGLIKHKGHEDCSSQLKAQRPIHQKRATKSSFGRHHEPKGLLMSCANHQGAHVGPFHANEPRKDGGGPLLLHLPDNSLCDCN